MGAHTGYPVMVVVVVMILHEQAEIRLSEELMLGAMFLLAGITMIRNNEMIEWFAK